MKKLLTYLSIFSFLFINTLSAQNDQAGTTGYIPYGCSNLCDNEALLNSLRVNGMLEYDIKILDDDPNLNSDEDQKKLKNGQADVIDYANKGITFYTESVANTGLDLEALLYDKLDGPLFEDITSRRAIITDNDNFCEGAESEMFYTIESIAEEMGGADITYWIHLWKNEGYVEGENNDKIFVKVKLPGQEGNSAISFAEGWMTHLLDTDNLSPLIDGVASDELVASVMIDDLSNAILNPLTPTEMETAILENDPNLITTNESCALEYDEDIVFAAPSGIPMKVPSDVVPIWEENLPSGWSFDLRSPQKVMVYQNKKDKVYELARGKKNNSLFLGYYNKLDYKKGEVNKPWIESSNINQNTDLLSLSTFNDGFENHTLHHFSYPFLLPPDNKGKGVFVQDIEEKIILIDVAIDNDIIDQLLEYKFDERGVYDVESLASPSIAPEGIVDKLNSRFKLDIDNSGEFVNITDEIYDSYFTFIDGEDGLTGKVYILGKDDICSEEWNQMWTDIDGINNGPNDFIEAHVLLTNDNGNDVLYSTFFLKGAPVIINLDDEAEERASTTPFGYALKFAGNGAVDYFLQALLNRIVHHDVNDWPSAFQKASLAQAAWSGFSSLLPWKKWKEKSEHVEYIEHVAQGFVKVIDEYKKSQTPPVTPFTLTDGLRHFTNGFGESYFISFLFKKVGPYARPVLINGLDRFHSLIPSSSQFGNTIKELIESGSFALYNYDNIVPDDFKDAYKVLFLNPGLRQEISNLSAMTDDLISVPSLYIYFKGFPHKIEAWKALDDMAGDIGSTWKRNTDTLDKLADDLVYNPNLPNYLKAPPNKFNIWNEVKEMPPNIRSDVAFLDAYGVTRNAIRPDGTSLDEHIFEGHAALRNDGTIKGIKGVHHNDAITELSEINPVNSLPINPPHPSSNYQTGIAQGTKTTPNSGGVYEAEVWIWGTNNSTGTPVPTWRKKNGNGGFASFFPDSWSKQKVKEEIAYVRSRLTVNDWVTPGQGGTSNEWRGISTDGNVEIGMYIGTSLSSTPVSVPSLTDLYGSSFPIY